MIVHQLVLPDASMFERKSQRIDEATLAARHEVRVVNAGEAGSIREGIAHVYGGATIDPAALRGLRIPYVATARVTRARLPWLRAPEPRRLITPLKDSAPEGTFVPEAVDEHWFDAPRTPQANTIGSLARPSVMNHIEQTMARIDRFRDDVDWRLFDSAPTPQQLTSLSVWVDPATDDADYDGWVAEALAAGLPVVASRTPINLQRLEKGHSGLLVPQRDPNEMTHAILTALFKPEVARARSEAARQTAAKYRPRHRLRALEQVYESLS